MVYHDNNVAVLGAGSFGTAIAAAAARSCRNVDLVCRTEAQASHIRDTGRNSAYFPGIDLPSNIRATSDINVCKSVQVLLLAIPARHLDTYINDVVSEMPKGAIVINLIKGLDSQDLTFAHHFQRKVPDIRYAALKGPTFARPLLQGDASGLTIGSPDPDVVQVVRQIFRKSSFDFDHCDCAMSVDAVSALKNIYAILLGITVSLELSENTKFMIITRILREASNVLLSLGLNPGVVSLYCGVGDILLTGTCDTSRNRTLGVMIGKGIPVDPNRPDFLAEGVRSVRIMVEHLQPGSAPLIELLERLLDGDISPGVMVEQFMSASQGHRSAKVLA